MAPISLAIETLEKEKKNKTYDAGGQGNALIRPTAPRPVRKTGQSMNDLLAEFEDLGSFSLAHLYLAFHYFRILAAMVDRLIRDGALVEMRPQNIRIDLKDDRMYYLTAVYNDYNEYKDSLFEDRVYGQITKDFLDPFVPMFLATMRRSILVALANDENKSGASIPNAETGTFCCRYRFLDSAPEGGNACPGDWVRIKGRMCRVKEVDLKDRRILLGQEGRGSPEAKDGPPLDVLAKPYSEPLIYQKEIDFVRYHLYMLGVYLHRLFFVGAWGLDFNKPNKTNMIECGLANELALTNIRVEGFDKIGKVAKEEIKLGELYTLLMIVYCRCVFWQDGKSYLNVGDASVKSYSNGGVASVQSGSAEGVTVNKKVGIAAVSALNDDLGKLQRAIAVYLKVASGLDISEGHISSQSFNKDLWDRIKQQKSERFDRDMDELQKNELDVRIEALAGYQELSRNANRERARTEFPKRSFVSRMFR